VDRAFAAHDIAIAGRRVRVKAPGLEPEIADQCHDFGGGFQDRVGSELGEVTVFFDGLNHAAEPCRSFVNGHRQTHLTEAKGGGEAGDASSDDGDRMHGRSGPWDGQTVRE
jgi:hypothetical protein